MRKKFENLTEKDLAYLAGFIDGDGSIFSQIVEGSDYKYGFTVRVSVVLFQKKTKKWFLMQMHDLLGFGVVRERNDNMMEYVITSIDAVEKFLLLLKPYIIIKKNILMKVLEIIKLKRSVNNVNDFIKICELVDSTLDDTDGKNKIINSLYVKAKLKDKFPVETLLK